MAYNVRRSIMGNLPIRRQLVFTILEPSSFPFPFPFSFSISLFIFHSHFHFLFHFPFHFHFPFSFSFSIFIFHFHFLSFITKNLKFSMRCKCFAFSFWYEIFVPPYSTFLGVVLLTFFLKFSSFPVVEPRAIILPLDSII